MQKAGTTLEEALRRKEREDILLAMGRMLDQVRDEREAFEERLDKGGEEVVTKVEQALEHSDVRTQKIEERVTRLQRETVSTLQRIEDKVGESYEKVEKKVDLSTKAIQTMVMVAVFGFAVVTLAIIVLFIVLLKTI